ncbi:MAG TPA: hypothetical protein VG711_10560 [Phycisphaerales bacterium]|nr:hypothetical protein [Phycisphaerales bacterium]
MAGTLNAIGLLLCVGLTIAALVWGGVRKPTVRRVAGGVGSGIFAAILFSLFTPTLGNAGDPLMQWAIPCVCFMFVVCLVRSDQWRQRTALLLMIGAIVLSAHFMMGGLGHRSYTGFGNRRPAAEMALAKSLRKECAMILLDHSVSYPAGWVEEVIPVEDEDIQNGLQRLHEKCRISHCWHTWLTGMYRVEYVPADVWFTGGTLAEDGGTFEVRERVK